MANLDHSRTLVVPIRVDPRLYLVRRHSTQKHTCQAVKYLSTQTHSRTGTQVLTPSTRAHEHTSRQAHQTHKHTNTLTHKHTKHKYTTTQNTRTPPVQACERTFLKWARLSALLMLIGLGVIAMHKLFWVGLVFLFGGLALFLHVLYLYYFRTRTIVHLSEGSFYDPWAPILGTTVFMTGQGVCLFVAWQLMHLPARPPAHPLTFPHPPIQAWCCCCSTT